MLNAAALGYEVGLPRGALRYVGEVRNIIEACVENGRRGGGRRYLRGPVPALLLMNFVERGRVVYGNRSAVVHIDLDRGVLYSKSLGLSVRLSRSVIKALREELGLDPRPKFALQLSRRGLRVIAIRRAGRSWSGGPLLIIAVDVNSRRGFSVLALALDESAKLVYRRCFRPPNGSFNEALAALLRSYASLKDKREAVARWLQRWGLRPRLAHSVLERFAELCSRMRLTPSAAGRMASRMLKAASARRKQFLRDFIGVVRGLAREWMGRGYHVAVVVDLPDGESLRSTKLQGTLLRVSKLLENLARYEGLDYLQLSGVSGKVCPLCGSRGVRVKHRYYKCGKCGLEYGRDWCACYRLARIYLEAGRKVRGAEKMLEALQEWLKQHPRALAPRLA